MMRNSNSPWEDWKLDAELLERLNQWAIDNPRSSLDKVLERMCNAIESGQEFFEVIPDGVFPARGLVKALAHLVKLGKTVALAKEDTYSFAMEVVRWINTIQQAFSANRKKWVGRDFTRAAWASLQEIRDIIDEICHWAAARLSDQRWSFSGVRNKLQASAEIEEFRRRIAKAKAIFSEVGIIDQCRGIDVILDHIGIIRSEQKRIYDVICRIKADQRSQLDAILARIDEADLKAQAQAEARRKAEEAKARREQIERIISEHTVENPRHDAQGKRPCESGTRVEVLAEVNRWVNDINATSQNFFWLTGDPGCGKSAITASLAQTSRENDTLWAEFFINRNNTKTTNPNHYFPTIVHQFANRSSETREKIYDLLDKKIDGALLAGISPAQAANLFINSIRMASELVPSNQPIVIVIDGLDETEKERLESTAKIFSELFHALSDLPNAKIFISSRTEDEIRNPFAHAMQGNDHVKHVHLDTRASFNDVATYLHRSLERIWIKHDLSQADWPSDDDLKVLADSASGLFIWAVTVIGFFQDEIGRRGNQRLSSILKVLKSHGSMNINTLYYYIISQTYDAHEDWDFETFRRLIGAIVVLCEPVSIADLSNLLDLREAPSSPPVDIVQFVRRLRTVLVSGAEPIHGQTIPRVHKSFFEYVISPNAAVKFLVDERYKVDTTASHRELGIRCLHQLSQAQSATASYIMPSIFRYAARFWSQHLSFSKLVSSIVTPEEPNRSIDGIAGVLQDSFGKSLIPPIYLSVSGALVEATVLGQTCAWDISTGLVDGGISFASIATQPVPLSQSSQLSKSPPPTVVGILTSNSEDLGWVLPHHGFGSWNPKTQKTEILHRNVRLRAAWTLSSGTTIEGGYFAETQNGDICIWNIHSCKSRTVKFFQETGKWEDHISCLTLSPAGKVLAAGCTDGTLHFWNLENKLVTLIPTVSDTPSKSNLVVFSADGGKALSCDNDTIIVLKLLNGKFHHQRSIGLARRGDAKGAALRSLAFSHDSTTILSGHGNGTISIWDLKSGELVGSMTTNHPGGIILIQPAGDGASIVSGTERGGIDIWHLASRQSIASFSHGNTGISACILPRGDQMCVANVQQLRLLDIQGKHRSFKQGREPRSMDSPSDLVPTSAPPFFYVEDYDVDHLTTSHGVQCIPSKRVDSGLWAIIGNHVIRGQDDGSLIVVQLDASS